MYSDDLNYREEQKIRRRSWEMLKYLKRNPQLMNERICEIYECFCEV